MSHEDQGGWSLRVTAGPASGTALPLGRGQTVIGRVVQPGDANLRDDSISRRHAVITVDAGTATITDAGSTNGTFVNGRQIRGPVSLINGDRIGMGETEFLLVGPVIDVGGASTTRRVRAADVAQAAHTAAVPGTTGITTDEPALQTILFTDLVESTRMAHSLGDDTAVRILGVHDQVVRRVLGEQGGREVKHTGDGIMAAFPSAARGVQAAIDIMRGIERHNASLPQPELRIRIGLNAGEPLVSGGDLYGLAVGLAARLCAAAEPGSIMASEAVRVLCLGKGKRFVDRGARTFKGIDAAVSVCEVSWAEDEGG